MSAMSCLVEIRENRISAVDKIPPLWFKLLSFNARKNISSAAFVMRLRWEKFSDNSFVLLRGKKCINYPWRNEASLLWAFSFLAAKSLYEKIPMYKSYINAMQISSTVANLTVSRFSSPATAVTKTDRHGGAEGARGLPLLNIHTFAISLNKLFYFVPCFLARKRVLNEISFLWTQILATLARSCVCMCAIHINHHVKRRKQEIMPQKLLSTLFLTKRSSYFLRMEMKCEAEGSKWKGLSRCYAWLSVEILLHNHKLVYVKTFLIAGKKHTKSEQKYSTENSCIWSKVF